MNSHGNGLFRRARLLRHSRLLGRAGLLRGARAEAVPNRQRGAGQHGQAPEQEPRPLLRVEQNGEQDEEDLVVQQRELEPPARRLVLQTREQAVRGRAAQSDKAWAP